MDAAMLDAAINALVTLLVVIDPIGLAPIFLALTAGTAAAARRRLAVRGIVIAAAVLLVFALAGDAVLSFIGISMPAFRIAGGLLLFLTALDMLFERRTERREKQGHEAEATATDPSVFPLATPLIAGPGAIATVILLMGQHEGNIAGQAMVLGVLALVLGLTLVSLLMCGVLERALRRTGVLVVTRLLGMLLAALSVQFVLDGLAAYGMIAGR
ncbi:MarC family protein [Limibaculum sp. FT325]|uniref:MarC family protein n=1 Tax=Thermohalobaculum sediminis TaxID=2939436 RepID=UPI0020BD4CBD|nr:MarC family protein [Limibaculum sediminis]MCL5777549.1 MarC family protein [Limibaculum sediminis]